MSTNRRKFSALITHDSVSLVEYATERTGMRVVEEWLGTGRSTSIDEAMARLRTMLSALGVQKVSLSLAIEQFGAFHHLMSLPAASDAVLHPIVRREVQRVFGVTDPIVAFTRGAAAAQRGDAAVVAPRQLFIAGAPRETIDALAPALRGRDIDVEILTVVPKAVESLYQANGGALEPTAVLVCLEGGPHLSFFLDGRLELAIDPPIALEGDPASVRMIVDQVERGTVYLRQQFRGATATRLLLAARPREYDALADALETRLGMRVKPLFLGATSPEGVVAMGAVLEAQQSAPLDIFPHGATLASRATTALRGPNGIVAAAATAAVVAGIWAAMQFATLSATQRDVGRLRTSLQVNARAAEPARQIVERRAIFAEQIDFVRKSQGERSALVGTLESIARGAPAGIRFDSLSVVRTADAWSTMIAGRATGATTAQAVRTLDAFYRGMRDKNGVSSASLEQFDYPAPADSAHKFEGELPSRAASEVVIIFRLSLAIARPVIGER